VLVGLAVVPMLLVVAVDEDKVAVLAAVRSPATP
jgi:hypothetical protein